MKREERRRARQCPSCRGGTIVRGGQVDGISILLVPGTEESEAVTVPAYSDVCHDCGLVSLYVRVSPGSGQE